MVGARRPGDPSGTAAGVRQFPACDGRVRLTRAGASSSSPSRSRPERVGEELRRRGIHYQREGDDLGGLREGGYRVYMTTLRFGADVRRLERLATTEPTGIM